MGMMNEELTIIYLATDQCNGNLRVWQELKTYSNAMQVTDMTESGPAVKYPRKVNADGFVKIFTLYFESNKRQFCPARIKLHIGPCYPCRHAH